MRLFLRQLVFLAGSLMFTAVSGQGASLYTTNVQPGGSHWGQAIWKSAPADAAASPIAGNDYTCIFNGVPFGQSKNNTRIRNPDLTPVGITSFPGDSLTLDANSELRMKKPGTILDFPGAGTKPGLILNGGVLTVADDGAFRVTGRVHVLAQSYICPAEQGGGAVGPTRRIDFAAQLSGDGTLVIMQSTNTVSQEFSCPSNTFSGQWVIKAGWLLGSGPGSLGTNSIKVDPKFVLPLDSSILNVVGPALFEVNYDLNSAGSLILTNGGAFRLHQDVLFSAAIIEGTTLAKGRHSYAELFAAFPNNFSSGGNGSITIQPYGPPPPIPPEISVQPVGAVVEAGTRTELAVVAGGTAPLSYRWQRSVVSNSFGFLADTATLKGTETATLSFSAVAIQDAGDYRVLITNTAGSVTSRVATLVVTKPDANIPSVAALNPAAGATLDGFTQLQVIFDRAVVAVEAGYLLVNGAPAVSVSGSGATYLFTFSQPAPGGVLVEWDRDNGITDQTGRFLDATVSWAYTLLDSTAPAMVLARPAPGASVSSLGLVQVDFNEAVTGVDASDLLVNGAGAISVSGAGSGPFIFDFGVLKVDGLADFNWAPANGIHDDAGNAFIGGGWSVNVVGASAASITNVLISEFLAANVSAAGLKDEDQQTSDWIELYNAGSSAVDLTGWGLTDDPAQPAKWSFPKTNLAPARFLVVFASGKDRRVPGARLHTNFKLRSGGGYLALYGPENPPLLAQEFAPEYPAQRNDISYGLDSARQPRFFAVATPGAPNSSGILTGAVDRMHFGVKRGFFRDPFELVLSTETVGATIVYTTNGSVPSLVGGVLNGIVYSGPVAIVGTAVVRAAAFAPGLLSTPVESQSYLFIENIVRQPNDPPGYPTGNVWTPSPGTVQSGSRAYYQMDPKIVNDPAYSDSVRLGLLSIPTLSISSPIDGIFGAVNGIYTHPESRGPAWERACSAEIIYPEGQSGIQVDSGIQIQGGTQRQPGKNAKHSFKLVFKGEYGPSMLDYPIFVDSPITTFNSLVLDGGINYWWHYVGSSSPVDQRFRAQCVRDQYTSDLMLALGQPSFHGRFFNVYLNGLYWGIHYVHEMPDEEFAAGYYGGEAADYDVLKNTTTMAPEVLAGDLQVWNNVMALSNGGLTNNSQYAQLSQLVDIDNLIDYMIVNHWVGNDDWPHHNWYALRKRTPPGPFQFHIWDAEHVMKSATIDRTKVNNTGTPAQIYAGLTNNAEFRLRYADRLQRHFFNTGVFYTDPDPTKALWDSAHPERNVPASLYMKRIREIDTAIVAESARWGGYTLTTNYTRNDHWLRELNNLLGFTNNSGNTANFFPRRSATVLAQYRNIGLYPAVAAPVFSQPGGAVPFNYSLSLTNPGGAGKIYYTTNGTDPRVYAAGTVAPGAMVYASGSDLALKSSLPVKARVLNGSAWSALAEAAFSVASFGVPLRITELMYNPVGGGAYEYLEIQNVGPSPVDLAGFHFEGVSYVFPNGSQLAPNGVLVLASSTDPGAFAARYPGVVVSGWFSGALSNSGERVALLDPNGNVVLSVDYRNDAGWPAAADGKGYSLEMVDPNGNPDEPANWRASAGVGGSPGLANAITPQSPVVLNEVLADSGGTAPDWVELHNAGPTAANIANWSFTDGGNARKFVFPPGTSIPANGYLLVWCDSATNASGLRTGFALNREGESLFLYNQNTNRVDALTFGLQLTNYTVGRVGDLKEWRLTTSTPGAVNAPATLSKSLLINEWMANPSPGGEDWLELYNPSSVAPAALQGLWLTTSNNVFQVQTLAFVPPGGFVQLHADEKPGPLHLDFRLSAAGDSIALYDPQGQLLDRVSFGSQAEGVSVGRLPDGSASIRTFEGAATPGASNFAGAYSGPILNEIMARNRSAVYDARGENPDWVELYNPGPAAYALSGMRLDLDGSKAWTFPTGASIAARSWIVVWCDGSRPASTAAGTALNTGFSLDAEGGTLRLLNTLGQPVDTISFGPQPADLSIGRTDGAWSLLGAPTPGGGNSTAASIGPVSKLRINEWMADPKSGSDWIELYNPEPRPVMLTGLFLTDDPSVSGITNLRLAPLSFISPAGWVKFIADGAIGDGPNHLPFSLDKYAGTIRLYGSDLSLIDAVNYGLQAEAESEGRLPDGANSITRFSATATPGAGNFLPLEDVRINEVLSHTDPPLEDAIELYNQGPVDIDLGGWFLSNEEENPRKYEIPTGTILPARGYVVFYENQFKDAAAVPFSLNSAHGDQIIVSQAVAGGLTGFRAQGRVGAAENGVSWGRFPTSAGEDFVPLAARSFGVDTPETVQQFRAGRGLTNSAPRVGPVVISEIMYRPVTGSGTNLVELPKEEYVEISNISTNWVPLFDPAATTNTWKFGGGIEYTLPSSLYLPPHGYVVVVSFDPADDLAALLSFREKYRIPQGTLILGPFQGRLGNSADTISLWKPDAPQEAPHPDAGYVPYVLVESVSYTNGAPWPAGEGFSVQRRDLRGYANEPLNWEACAANPGAPNCAAPGGDADHDGLPDDWESANGLNPGSAAGDDGADGDPDRDGFKNQDEFIAGTHPRDASSRLGFDAVRQTAGGIELRFSAVAGRTYTIQFRETVGVGEWRSLGNFGPCAVQTDSGTNDLSSLSNATRYYRLVTPAIP